MTVLHLRIPEEMWFDHILMAQRKPTCRKTKALIKCDLTPALSHMVQQRSVL